MKAELDSDGRLTISSENQLEAYALRMWTEHNCPDTGPMDTSNLLFRREVPDEDAEEPA